jgi:hypothetical protein
MPIKPTPLSDRARQLLERAFDRGFVSLQCESCGRDVDISDTLRPENQRLLMDLIEHCSFEHLSRTGIVGVSNPTLLVGGYALAASLGFTPQTKHEEEWRKSVSRHPSGRP